MVASRSPTTRRLGRNSAQPPNHDFNMFSAIAATSATATVTTTTATAAAAAATAPSAELGPSSEDGWAVAGSYIGSFLVQDHDGALSRRGRWLLVKVVVPGDGSHEIFDGFTITKSGLILKRVNRNMDSCVI